MDSGDAPDGEAPGNGEAAHDRHPDAVDDRRRSMTCGASTANEIAWAQLMRTLRGRAVVFPAAIGAGLGWWFGHGYGPGATLVLVLTGAVAMTWIGWATTYRRLVRLYRSFFPADGTVSVHLRDDALRVSHGVGEVELPYAKLAPPVVAGGHVLVGVRNRPGRQVVLPSGLLTEDDAAWLRERIDRPEPTDRHAGYTLPEAAPVEAAPVEAPTLTSDDGSAAEHVVTEELLRTATRVLLRRRLRDPWGRVLIGMMLLVWALENKLFDNALVATGFALAAGALGVLVMARSLQRKIDRELHPGQRLRTRFDETHLHYTVDDRAPTSLAYRAVRRCTVHGELVLLSLHTGPLMALPRQLVPDEALERFRADRA